MKLNLFLNVALYFNFAAFIFSFFLQESEIESNYAQKMVHFFCSKLLLIITQKARRILYVFMLLFQQEIEPI